MALWNLHSSVGSLPTVPASVNAVADSTAHTKGAWVEVSASLPADVVGFSVIIGATGASGTDTRSLLDVGVGAAGSEVVFVPDLAVGSAVGSGWTAIFYEVPVPLPEGARLAVRSQSAASSKSVPVQVILRAGQTMIPGDIASGAVAIGASAASSGGVAVVGTSWVEIEDSTAVDLAGWLRCAQVAAPAAAIQMGQVIIGVGASGSEQAIDSAQYDSSASELFGWRNNSPTWCRVPAGSRIAAKLDRSNASGVYVHLVGLT